MGLKVVSQVEGQEAGGRAGLILCTRETNGFYAGFYLSLTLLSIWKLNISETKSVYGRPIASQSI